MGNGSVPGGAASDFDHERRFVRASDVLWRQVADVILARTVADPEIVQLDGSAVLLWAALTEPVTAAELARELASFVGAPEPVVARDVYTALAHLVRCRLVTELEGA